MGYSRIEYVLLVEVEFRKRYHRPLLTGEETDDRLRLICDTISYGFDAERDEAEVAQQLWESGAVE